jgi:hypothetical protein
LGNVFAISYPNQEVFPFGFSHVLLHAYTAMEQNMPKLKRYQEKHNQCDPNDTQLFTTEELANKIKISEKTLTVLRTRGGGPRFFKVTKGKGARVLYDWKDVLVYLESHKRISTSDTGGNQ